MQINLLDDEGWIERRWPPERPGFRWRRKRVAAEQLGASLYELPPGESTFPYHYELGMVVSGFALPRAAVQVDSNKLMIRWGSGENARRWFFLDDAVGYWDGEAAE